MSQLQEGPYFSDLLNPKPRELLYYFGIQNLNLSIACRELSERTIAYTNSKILITKLAIGLVGSEFFLALPSQTFSERPIVKYSSMAILFVVITAKISAEILVARQLKSKMKLNQNQLIAIQEDSQALLTNLAELEDLES